jgi:hypothetical protein
MSRSVFAAFLLAVVIATGGLRPPLAAQQKGPPPAPPPQYPTLTTPASLGITIGTPAELTLTGTNLADAVAVWTSAPGVTFSIPPGQTDAAKLTVKAEAKDPAAVGLYQVRVVTKSGVSNFRPFCLDGLPAVAEKDGNGKAASAQVVPVPCVVTGATAAEASDFYRVSVKPGQTLTVEALARRVGSPLDPVVILYDAATGRELPGLYADDTPGLQGDARVTHTFGFSQSTAEVVVEVRDATYRGGADFAYRLRIGEFPGVTTAFPLAVQAGKAAQIGGSGPGGERVTKAELTGTPPAVYFAPKPEKGPTGWPVPVRVSPHPEAAEQEPNNEPGKANKLPVPGGASAVFAAKGDVDHFAFPGKKGQKLEVVAEAYALNAPTEVYLRVLDAKGAELAKSDPAKPTARIEFSPPADGEYVVAAENLNYLHGPNEVYHLSVRPDAPDFEVQLGLDRFDVAPGGWAVLPVTGLAKLNGFSAPVELTVAGVPGLLGSLTLPAGANPTPQAPLYLPVSLAPGGVPGHYPVMVRAAAKVGGQVVEKPAAVTDVVRAGLAGLPNVPPEMTTQLAAVVTDRPPFRLEVDLDRPATAAGTSAKGKVLVRRAGGFDGEVQFALVSAPAGVTLKAKPAAKGAADAEAEFVADAKAAAGAGPVVVKGTGKHQGKDFAYVAVLPKFEVTPAAKKK